MNGRGVAVPRSGVRQIVARAEWIMFGMVALQTGSVWADSISTTVRILPDATPAAATQADDDQAPPPMLPTAKLPQYELRHPLTKQADSADRLRLLLALPEHPVVMEALISIDGIPFREVRERRIEAIVREARAPVDPSSAEVVPVDSAAAEGAVPETPAPETGSADDAPTDQDGDDDAEELVPPTKPGYSLAQTAAALVERYLAATEREISVDEVRWLLEKRMEGPTLLVLKDNFQRFRAEQRPAFAVLDRDQNGELSATEIDQATDSFKACDLDRDEVVEASEIAEAAASPLLRGAIDGQSTGQLVFALPAALTDSRSLASLASRYSQEQLAELKAENLAVDLAVKIAFDSKDPTQSTLAVIHTRDERFAAPATVTGPGTISFFCLGARLMVTATQGSLSTGQISVGAVNDGYPLLPELDPNDDLRFTIREMRELSRKVRRLDGDGDGVVSTAETQPPVRICFGLGATVHRHLARVRSFGTTVRGPKGPEWFQRMDRNRDNDLTRSEFPGTDERFAALDADQDGLVSAREASDYDKRQ